MTLARKLHFEFSPDDFIQFHTCKYHQHAENSQIYLLSIYLSQIFHLNSTPVRFCCLSDVSTFTFNRHFKLHITLLFTIDIFLPRLPAPATIFFNLVYGNSIFFHFFHSKVQSQPICLLLTHPIYNSSINRVSWTISHPSTATSWCNRPSH